MKVKRYVTVCDVEQQLMIVCKFGSCRCYSGRETNLNAQSGPKWDVRTGRTDGKIR